MRKIHIVGVCGTFMGGVARLAKELGLAVSGSDANTYPPMSTQLEALGIELFEGYHANNLPGDADCFVIGNTVSRGNPELEMILDRGLPYTSGAEWLKQNVLRERWVLAVAGTHGKTTTSSILAWLLHDNGLSPGYLIGGVPENFGETARLGETPFFVIEADEYDTAFSDKRSKFVHYQPRTLVLNNLEYDHADIFPDLAAIQTQFHHLLKTVPDSGRVIYNHTSSALLEVIDLGLWSESATLGPQGDWTANKLNEAASEFEINHAGQAATVTWSLIGEHNMNNALAAVAAAHHVGVPIEQACASLSEFRSVKRRLELIHNTESVKIYDDFAHHPTAIAETISALRNRVGTERIIAVLEPRSNTMKRGIHKNLLADALQFANKALIFADDQVLWDIDELASDRIRTFTDITDLQRFIIDELTLENSRGLSDNRRPTHILIMSNGGFHGLHQSLITQLE